MGEHGKLALLRRLLVLVRRVCVCGEGVLKVIILVGMVGRDDYSY